MTFVKAYTRQGAEFITAISAEGATQVAAVTAAGTSLVNQAASSALQGRLRVDDRNTYISVAPSSTWNGTAGTGFSVTPTDPTRTTAKPAMRLIVPPNQAFTDYLVAGVSAWANNAGAFDNCGLKQVTFYYEGSTATVTAPSFYSFQDANGKTVTYFGWWAVLLHNGTNGDARLYVEATPKDTTMQSRVIGPYLFLPSSALYDLELTVAPSQSVIAGSRYQSITAALTYCAAQGKHHPRITITEARTDYLLATIGSPFIYTTGKGYVTIDATVPVTIIGNTTFATSSPRTKYDGMRFKGSNITLDYRTMDQMYHEGAGNKHWFDGVNVTNSGGRGDIVPSTKAPRVLGLARNGGYVTECTITALPNTANQFQLVRGNTMSSSYFDCVSEAECVIGNRVDDYDAYVDWAKDTNAFTVTYSGASSTATLELSGGSNATSRTFTAKENGVSVGTLTVTYSTTCANVVSWINGLSGWSATLQSDAIRASFCSIPNNTGSAFAAQNVKGVTLQIVTFYDAHGDFYQQNSTSLTENVIVADNVVTNFAGQFWFISSAAVASDFFCINNAFHGKTVTGWTFYTQWGRTGFKSHNVFVHNSCTQPIWLRTAPGSGTGGWNADAYCFVGANAIAGVVWDGTPDTDVRITDNHVFTGSTSPSNSTGTTIGGDATSLWQSASTGDFTPKGALLTNLKLPVIARDQRGRRRSKSDAAGASV